MLIQSSVNTFTSPLTVLFFSKHIHLFTINNSLSSTSFYAAAQSELDMWDFVGFFSSRLILQGPNLLLNNSWKVFFFMHLFMRTCIYVHDCLCVSIVLTQTYWPSFLRLECAVAAVILSKPRGKSIIPRRDQTTSLALRSPGGYIALVVITKSQAAPAPSWHSHKETRRSLFSDLNSHTYFQNT